MSALVTFRRQFPRLPRDLLLLTVGILFVLLLLPFVLLITLPFYLYRLFVSKVVAPYYRPDVAKPVSGLGMLFANEFPYIKGQGARCNNVINFVLEGTADFDQFKETINTNWITAKSENGELLYPEFQQYVEYWMGYMFWKQDKEFSLEKHVQLHTIPDNATNSECEKFVCNLIENCINDPFPLKKSPWEMHIIHNYKNAEFGTADEKLTTFVVRLHHTLADGYAILHLLVHALLETPFKEIDVAVPASVSQMSFLRAIKLPFALLHEIGTYLSLYFRKKTPWHIDDKDKHWKLMYTQSELIPIKKLKDIKNRLNVNFTATLFSCISAGVAKSLSESTGSGAIKDMIMGFPIPLPGHPFKLRNHAAGGVFAACTDINVDPFTRLNITTTRLNYARQSVLLPILTKLTKVLACHLAPVTKYLVRNVMIPSGLTNFPGPGIILNWHGHKVLGTYFVSGLLQGVGGVGFMTLSYNDSIRVIVNAESAVMTREEQRKLIQYINEEIDNLWMLSNKCRDCKIHMEDDFDNEENDKFINSVKLLSCFN